MLANPLWWATNHRGPYFLYVVRPARKPGFMAGEWLLNPRDAEDVEEESRAYLTDPRDTVSFINVWSDREEQFVMTFRRKDYEQ